MRNCCTCWGGTLHAVAIMGQALALEPTDGEHRAYLEGQMEKFAVRSPRVCESGPVVLVVAIEVF